MTYNLIEPIGLDTGATLNLHKRVTFIQKHLDIQGKKILDCGCGVGLYTLELLGHGADAVGIEYNEKKVTLFKQGHPDIAERVHHGNIETMDFADGSFDYALLNEVLEHIPNESKALFEIHRVLKPQGSLIIFSPNRLYPFETHAVCLRKYNLKIPITIPFIPYIPLRLGTKIFTYSARNYWPVELKRLIRKSGFTIQKTKFIWQTFENISGDQPKLVTWFKPLIRILFGLLEQIPLIDRFGVSQVIIARKS